MYKPLSELKFSRETVKYMIYKLETKIEKAINTVKAREGIDGLHVFVSEEIVYVREQGVHITVDIEVLDCEDKKYAVKLRGFKPSGCQDYYSPTEYVYSLDGVEKVVISLILDLILK